MGTNTKDLHSLVFCACGCLLFVPSLISLDDVDNILFDTHSSKLKENNTTINELITVMPLGSRNWWDFNWTKSKKIVIQHEYVYENFEYFPVLISGIDSNLSEWTQLDGSDLVFVSKDNLTVFPHELELFNAETSEVIAWVNITNLSSVEDTTLYLYYGNPNCSSQQNVLDTWDENYVGVFHMNQLDGMLIDSAFTQNAVGYENGTVYRQTGRVGYGVELGGDIDGGYFLMSHDAYLFHNDDVTIEAWINLHRNKNSDDTIVYFGRHSISNPGPRISLRKLKQQDHMGKISLECGNFNTNMTQIFSDYDASAYLHRWVYAAGAVDYSSNQLRLFIDGVQQINTNTVWPYQLPGLSVAAIGYDGMGDEQTSNWNYLDGRLDEIRISNTSRSLGWINTTYNCITFPNSFSDFGFAFTVNIDIFGNGVIHKNPDQTAYERNAIITLSAIPQSGWVFDHWSGDLVGSMNPEQIVLDDNKYIMGYFRDIQPPDISNFTVTPSTVFKNSSISFECDVTDNSDVEMVNLIVTESNGLIQNFSMEAGSPYAFTKVFDSVGVYECHVWARDSFGNAKTSLSLIFEVLPQNMPPGVPVFSSPVNNSPYVSVYLQWLNVTVFDNDDDPMDVFFYWANGSLIGNVSAVSNGSVAGLFLPSVGETYWLDHDEQYFWYVIVNDSISSVTGPLWNFFTSKAWDINEDRLIGAEDLSLLSNAYLLEGLPGWIGSDINSDGEVGAEDLSLLANHYLKEY